MSRIIILLCAIFVIFAFLSVPVIAGTEPGPKIVQGYIKDANGNPIMCPVVVIIDSVGLDTTSNSSGFYRVTFAPQSWSIGDDINVTAQTPNGQISTHSVCTAFPVDVVNVQDIYAIPEYNIWGFVLALIILGVVGAWLLLRRKIKY